MLLKVSVIMLLGITTLELRGDISIAKSLDINF